MRAVLHLACRACGQVHQTVVPATWAENTFNVRVDASESSTVETWWHSHRMPRLEVQGLLP